MNYLSDALGFIEPELYRIKENLLHYDQNLIRLSVEELLDQKSPKLVLHEILHEFGFNSMQVKDIIDQLGGESGKLFYSKTHELLIDRDHLFIQPGKNRERKFFYIDNLQEKLEYPVPLALKIKENKTDFNISRSRDIAYLDLDKLSFPLILRTWKKGDYFMPLGMKNMVKLSDFYINNKLSLFDKENTWLLITDNKIAWIVGRRIDERFKITDSTKRILEVRLVK
jgi:tRNA(Ile)-lysidine synthase